MGISFSTKALTLLSLKEIVKDIGEFYLLTVFNMYISYSDQIPITQTDEEDDVDAISVDSVKILIEIMQKFSKEE